MRKKSQAQRRRQKGLASRRRQYESPPPPEDAQRPSGEDASERDRSRQEVFDAAARGHFDEAFFKEF